ncbi:MAG TPA: hypothetical protein VGD49_05395 [Longimicrobiales bacterium]
MYPPGHPSQEESAGDVVQRLALLLADRPTVSIGIARRQLVIEGVATDPRHPVLRSLAEKFHKQHIGAIVFQRGVGALDIADMMRTVAREPESGRALGLGDPARLQAWQSLRLYPLTYDQLELVGGPEEEENDSDEERDRSTRSAQLWIGLARAALATEGNEPPPTTDALVVAQAINEHPQAQAYDQVIVGYLLQIAQELKSEGGVGSTAVRKRMSRLISSLDPATLERLVKMGGDVSQRKQFVLDATQGLAADAVVDIVRAAADTSGQAISSSLVRMLSKLSAFAEQGPPTMQARADTALRDQVHDLLADWTLHDPNPDEYRSALQSLAETRLGSIAGGTRFAPENLRIVQMALEVDSVGVPLWRAVEELQRDDLPALLQTLRDAPDNNRAAHQIWQRIAGEESIRFLLTRPHVDFQTVNALIDRIPVPVATEILLDTLVNSEVRSTRMGVFRRLVAIRDPAVPAIVQRMSDERWYVLRNMVALLNEMEYVPTGVAVSELARHSDVRVRREAADLWLRMDSERERAIITCFQDTDDRVLRLGAAAAQSRCPEAAVPFIAARLTQEGVEEDTKAQLVRLLGQVRNPLAVDVLLKTVVSGKSLLGAPKLVDKDSVMLAALQTLAGSWQNDARAQDVLKHAAKSKDPEIRAAAGATA